MPAKEVEKKEKKENVHDEINTLRQEMAEFREEFKLFKFNVMSQALMRR